MQKTARHYIWVAFLGVSTALALAVRPAAASSPFHFSTGDPDGNMAAASRPESMGNFEIESADDFIVPGQANLTHATFTGLLPSGAPLSSISQVVVEFYRVFPSDSDTTRTIQVPTRTNSPADNLFTKADNAAGTLSYAATILTSSFTAANSVQPGGIHAMPNQTTFGNGPVTGEKVVFDVTFTPPIVLPADHYFLIPQVALTSGNFFWLSAPKPISASGTPFSMDLQSWTRDANLDPDWLRIGTDIVGGSPAPTFNGTFALDGDVEVLATPPPTASQTPTPSSGPSSTATPTARIPCLGDCDGSGQVEVYDVITLVNIALGTAEPATCPLGIPSGRAVDITLLVQAVNKALLGCPAG